MKLKILIGILVFLIIVNMATIGTFLYVHFKQDRTHQEKFIDRFGRMHTEHPHAERQHRMTRIPNEKRKQLRILLHEFHDETQEMRDSIQLMESEAFDLIQTDSVDYDRVDSLLQEISDLHLQISKKATAKLIKAKTYLSPKQREMFFKALIGSPQRMKPGQPFRSKGLGRPTDSLMRHRQEKRRADSH